MFEKISRTFFIIFFSLFSWVNSAIAQPNTGGTAGSASNTGPNTGGTAGSASNTGGTSEPIRLGNPLEGGGIRDIPTLIEEILKIIITIGVPIVALAIIYTGFLFVAAQGNPEKLKKAKDSLVYVVIGAAILLGAYAIAEGIGSTVAAIRGN